MPRGLETRAACVTGRGLYCSTFLLVLLASPITVAGQQVADLAFSPSVSAPAFSAGEGPVVLVDEAHYNFHTLGPTNGYGENDVAGGRFGPFADLLRADGYVVRPLRSTPSPEALQGVAVLVIANALSVENVDGNWALPNPSAFTEEEAEVIETWVEAGGSLLLIADHQPWPAAVAPMAERFGVLFNNGSTESFSFHRSAKSLRDHPITRGRSRDENIDSVMTFGGQAFRFAPGSPGDALLVVAPNNYLRLYSEEEDLPLERVPHLRADGMMQGAALRRGQGRVAAFGEAAMFTAQVDEEGPMGMNHPGAAQNAQFVLNVLHWLTGLLPD